MSLSFDMVVFSRRNGVVCRETALFNLLRVCGVLLFLLGNVISRGIILFQYPSMLLQGVVFLSLLSCFFPLVRPLSLKVFLFLFACSLPLYGSHSYQVHNIAFELFVSWFTLIFFLQSRGGAREGSNSNRLSLFLGCYILLAFFSLLLMPLSSLAGTLFLWGWQEFFSSVFQSPPGLAMYPIAAVNRLLLFFLFIHYLSSHRDRDQLFHAIFFGLVTGAVLASFVGVLNYYHLLPLGWLREKVVSVRRLHSCFGNPGWFAEFLSISIPFILLGFLNPRIGKFGKLLLFVVLVVCEMAILLTFSRTGWLVYPLVLISCWLVFYLSRKIESGELSWRSVGKTIGKVVLSVPLTIVISYFLVTYLIQVQDLDTGNMIQQRFAKIASPTARKVIWQESLAIGKEAPFFGLGYESYKYQVLTLSSISKSLFSKEREIKQIEYDTPHNHYLQLFISNGIIGVCFWIISIIYTILLLSYDLKIHKKYFNIAVLLSITAFHLYGLAQSMQYVSVIWFLVFLAMGYAMTIDESVFPSGIRICAKWLLCGMFVLTVTGGIVYGNNYSSHRLATKYGLHVYSADQDINRYLGFYPKEDWGKEGVYRWTGPRASVRLTQHGVFRINFLCSAPGLATNPLVLDILTDGLLLDRITFWNNKVVRRKFFFPSSNRTSGKLLEFRVSRTWNPRHERLSSDYRDLGVAVREPEYLYRLPTEDFGFYNWQIEETRLSDDEKEPLLYRWSQGQAVLVQQRRKNMPCVLVLKNELPWIQEHPLNVQFFQDARIVGSVQLSDNNWNRIILPYRINNEKPLVIRSARIWNMKREGYGNDIRDLGVAIGCLIPDEKEKGALKN